jgi:pimeloyl-ACP methyl ester carboxylesterase
VKQTTAHRTVGWAALLACTVLVVGCSSAANVADHKRPARSTPQTSTGSSPSTTPSSPARTSSPSSRVRFGKGPAGHGLGRFYRQHVTWRPCGGGDQCATIWVPLDYAKPDGPAITLAAKRQPAGDPAHRQGSLFINPGGPGESGIDYVSYVGFPASVTNVYDIVGFDPRGVGKSTPVDCLSDSELDQFLAADPTPDNPAEVARFQRLWAHYARGCQQRSGALLPHVSTVEAARDLDILRAVVHDGKLNYFGASYGTYLGATYAGLFPTHVRRMVLDGAVDPLAGARTTSINQAAGFETALTAYLHYCVEQGSCPLGSSVDAARSRLIGFFKQVDKFPLPTTSGRRLTEGLALTGVILPLYSRDFWRYETIALQQAIASGRGDTLLALADTYAARTPDGSYKNNSMEVFSAVMCLDHPEHETLAQIERDRRQFVARSPTFGPSQMWSPYGCSHWPVKATEPHPSYAAKGAPPIIVIGTTRDPATPYEQAVRLSHDLSSGVLLTRDGDGHTAYASGNTCIDDTVNAYFVNGRVPPDGRRC